MKYSFKIDEKSLFYGMDNDFKKGHSPTVHTPLNQAKDPENWHTDIYRFIDENKGVDPAKFTPLLKQKCTRHTTSQAPTELVKLFEFSSFTLDGQKFEASRSFAFFVKREIGKKITTRNGLSSGNTHLYREKLHYPTTFAHITDGLNIDNKVVLEKILEINGGFAFVVKGFDIDTDSNTINFRTIMVGPRNIPLSNVFRSRKGIGEKLLIDIYRPDRSYSTDTLTQEESDAFMSTLHKIQESSRKNGLIGEEYVFDNLDTFFDGKPEDKEHISKRYPRSPYDIECIINGEKVYVEVKSTQDSKKCFFMSKGERQFMEKYDDHYCLILVTDVKSDRKKTTKYKKKDIEDMRIMEQEYQTIKYIVK